MSSDKRVVIEELLVPAVSGDEPAWMELLSRPWTTIERLVRASRSLGSLRKSPDDWRNVVSLVFQHLRRDDFRALRLFPNWRNRNPGKTFNEWIRILTANVVRDYVSNRLGTPESSGLKRLVNTLAGVLTTQVGVGSAPSLTGSVAARELLEHARENLPASQLGALLSWLEGQDCAEIAALHNLEDTRGAQATVRAALARLRRLVRN